MSVRTAVRIRRAVAIAIYVVPINVITAAPGCRRTLARVTRPLPVRDLAKRLCRRMRLCALAARPTGMFILGPQKALVRDCVAILLRGARGLGSLEFFDMEFDRGRRVPSVVCVSLLRACTPPRKAQRLEATGTQAYSRQAIARHGQANGRLGV